MQKRSPGGSSGTIWSANNTEKMRGGGGKKSGEEEEVLKEEGEMKRGMKDRRKKEKEGKRTRESLRVLIKKRCRSVEIKEERSSFCKILSIVK